MWFLRGSAILLPQLLLILFVAGSHDLLHGWNQTDAAMGTLLALFFLNPIITLTLLVIEIVHSIKTQKRQSRKVFFFVGLAAVIFAEALAINFYLLTQVRM